MPRARFTRATLPWIAAPRPSPFGQDVAFRACPVGHSPCV
jgi:hypothetical protein